MDRSEIFDTAHRRHPIAAPVASERLRELVGWLSPGDGARAVDLGCGEGEWLQELLVAHPRTTGVGIDHMLPTSAVRRAGERGLTERVRWVETDAATWDDGVFDVVLCVGASHAFGRLDRDHALAVAREQRDAWIGGARRELGFATFVLHDTAAAAGA